MFLKSKDEMEKNKLLTTTTTTTKTQTTQAERAVALALRAFNVETAMAADSASAHSKKEGVPSLSTGGIGRSAGEHQRALASARLLWWKEAAVGAATSGSPSAAPPPDHPVARAIAAVAASGAVSPRSLSARLSRVATARAEDAAPTSSASASAAPFATMRDLENYGENTAAQLLYLQLEAAGVSSSSSSSAAADADHAASHLGRAAAIVSLLRGMKAHASSGSSGGIDGQRRCYLPVSELDAAGTSPRELFAVVDSRARARQKGREGGAMTAASSNNDDNNDPFFFPDSLREATRSVASAALSHLSAARKLRERLDSSSRAKTKCFLQSVGVERYLLLLERCGFDPLTADEVALGTQAARARYRAGLAVRTKWCSWRGTY